MNNAPNVLPIPLAEIRNQEEFGVGSEESTYDENSTKPANDLDLLVGISTAKAQTVHACTLLFTFDSLLAGGK